jgi:hypothetical protein
LAASPEGHQEALLEAELAWRKEGESAWQQEAELAWRQEAELAWQQEAELAWRQEAPGLHQEGQQPEAYLE